MSIPEFQDGARKFSVQERAELALWLLDSLPPADREDALHDSVAEADRRRTELDSGNAALVGAAEFWTAIREEREKWK
jgi:hypothetical protein